MPEFIIRAEETDLFFLFKNYEELVRCKDCRYEAYSVCTWHSGKDYTWIVDADDYCSCAERKIRK